MYCSMIYDVIFYGSAVQLRPYGTLSNYEHITVQNNDATVNITNIFCFCYSYAGQQASRQSKPRMHEVFETNYHSDRLYGKGRPLLIKTS